MMQYDSTDILRFSQKAPESREEISDLENQQDDEIGIENLSSDEQVGGATNERLFEVQALCGLRENQYQGCTEIKEQMYLDKLEHLKYQLKQLNDNTLPEYLKRLRRIEATHRECMRISSVTKGLEEDMVEQDFINEKRSAVRECEEQKVFLRHQLISELEDKQRMIEAERHDMELTGDLNGNLKYISTRKLRRRPNEGGHGANFYNEKRNCAGVGRAGKQPYNISHLNHLLQEQEINEDLKIINKTMPCPSISKIPANQIGNSVPLMLGIGGTGSSSGYFSTEDSRSHISNYPKDCRVKEKRLFLRKNMWYKR